MPFNSCPSNVRFSFLLPENCHSASGQLRSRLICAHVGRPRSLLTFPKADITDRKYELRDGSGIGVQAPQFGPRRTVRAGISKSF